MATAGWVVVVEATPTNREGAVDISQLRRLLEHMPGVDPVALHCDERVAVQVHVDAPGELEALGLALADLRSGLPLVGLSDLRVIRAEVLTREEFERDCHMAYGEHTGAGLQEVADDGADQASEELLRRVFEDPLTRLPSALATNVRAFEIT